VSERGSHFPCRRWNPHFPHFLVFGPPGKNFNLSVLVPERGVNGDNVGVRRECSGQASYSWMFPVQQPQRWLLDTDLRRRRSSCRNWHTCTIVRGKKKWGSRIPLPKNILVESPRQRFAAGRITGAWPPWRLRPRTWDIRRPGSQKCPECPAAPAFGSRSRCSCEGALSNLRRLIQQTPKL